MEPRIQYATGPDGASIAWWAMGEGPPLIIPPPASPFSHIEREWHIPEWRHWYEHLMRHVTVIRQLVAGKGFLFADRGESDLRGFEDPVRIFEVRWRERDA